MEGVTARLTNNQAGSHTIHNVVKKQRKIFEIEGQSISHSKYGGGDRSVDQPSSG